jgi:hypothetical protein
MPNYYIYKEVWFFTDALPFYCLVTKKFNLKWIYLKHNMSKNGGWLNINLLFYVSYTVQYDTIM